MFGTNIYIGRNVVNDTAIGFTKTIASNYTINGTESVILANTTSGNITVTLQPRLLNDGITIKRDSGTNVLTLATTAGTINGLSTLVVDSVITVKSDGINYYVVGKISNITSAISLINSQAGPAITLTGGIATYVTNPSGNTLAYNIDPTSDIFTRIIDAIGTTAQNTGTGETDLFTKTIAGSTLNTDKQTLNFEADGEFNDNTATAQLKLYFAGNVTLNTGAINISTANTGWRLKGYIMRT